MRPNPYCRCQARKDAEGDRQYREWVDEQSPKRQATLKRMGLDAPMAGGYNTSGIFHGDIAEFASHEPKIEDLLEGKDAPDAWKSQDVTDTLRHLLALLQSMAKSLVLDCFAFETNRGYFSDETQNGIAKNYRASKATVRKCCGEIREYLDQKLAGMDSAEAIRHAITYVQSKDKSLGVDCFAFATNLSSFCDETEADIAERHGVSTAAVSIRCIAVCDELNLPPAPGMKSARARKSYRRRQLKIKLSL